MIFVTPFAWYGYRVIFAGYSATLAITTKRELRCEKAEHQAFPEAKEATEIVKHIWTRNVLVLVFVVVGVSGCMDANHGRYGAENAPSSFSSEGERLYFTGTSSAGEQIRPVGGHHHMQMHGGSCATCHGAGKEGGAIMWPRFWVTAPALTDGALANEHDDGHDHASYDESSLKNAIVKGIGPDGEPLHDTMPRWRMSEESLNALVNYLLGEH